MQLISCHNGRLFTATRDEHVASERTFMTGLQALDELAPDGRFMRGAIHELLVDPSEGLPRFVAMLFAVGSASADRLLLSSNDEEITGPLKRTLPESHRAIIWCDPTTELYPTAIASFIPLEHLY